MLPYAEELEVDTIHVHPPSAVVFVCGGPYTNVDVKEPASFRDALLKIVDTSLLCGKELVQAEDITRLSVFSDIYDDILQFETDIAQITELIILFCESGGSLAELGAFCVIQEISERLLVIVSDIYWDADSFIRLGPLKHLENIYGSNSVFVLDDDYVRSGTGTISVAKVEEMLRDPIGIRLNAHRDPTTFDPNRSGHVIKLIVGLIQEYGALSIDEIDELLLSLGVYIPTKDIHRYLLCAQSVNWIARARKGSLYYYIAKVQSDAATIKTRSSRSVPNKIRRRYLIREHWRNVEPARYRAITEVAGAEA